MVNPGDYRELMKAVVGYSDKTVEQVQAEIASRDAAAAAGRRTPRRGGGSSSAATGAPITKGHIDALSALRAAADQAKADAAGT